MRRTFALALAALALFVVGACDVQPPAHRAAAKDPIGKRCADVLIRDVAGEAATGGMACLGPSLQAVAAKSDVSTDAELQAALAFSGVQKTSYLGETEDGGFVYVLRFGPGRTLAYVVWTDSDGLVVKLDYSTRP